MFTQLVMLWNVSEVDIVKKSDFRYNLFNTTARVSITRGRNVDFWKYQNL